MTRRVACVLGLFDFATALFIGFGVFVALPSRWAPVDVTAGALASLELASGVALVTARPWAARFAAVISSLTLATGLALSTSLAVTATWLTSVYGPVGRGGAVVLVLVAALLAPYLVVLPGAKLVWTLNADRLR